MSVCYVGDIHGRVSDFKRLDERLVDAGVTAIVQVGDFAPYWSGKPDDLTRYLDRRPIVRCPIYFVDGNHENHDYLDSLPCDQGLSTLTPQCYHVRRGTTLHVDGRMHLFCGGARSTDRGPGREFVKRQRAWWPQEAPTPDELLKFSDTWDQVRPDVVVTHDAPTCVPLYRESRDTDPTAVGFERVRTRSDHRPRWWFFGHHHVLDQWAIDGTTFACAGLHGSGWILSGSDRELDADILEQFKA